MMSRTLRSISNATTSDSAITVAERGLKIHAGHFAEEIAGAEFGDRIAVSEIDGGVRWNGSVSHFLARLSSSRATSVLVSRLKKPLAPALGFDVAMGVEMETLAFPSRM